MKTNYTNDVNQLRITILTKIKERLDQSDMKSMYNKDVEKVLKIDSAFSKYMEIWWYKGTMQFITWDLDMIPAVLVSCDELGTILDILIENSKKRNRKIFK